MGQFHTLSIKEINRQTDKAVNIIFDVPSEYASVYKFKAGQYLTLETKIDGEDVRRSYSISSEEGKDLGIVVKAIPDGKFSNYANSVLTEGDAIEVHPAEGKFLLPEQLDGKTFCAFAAGSGITPIMAMIRTLLSQSETAKFVLVYGNKSPEQTIYFQELLDLQKELPERLFIEFIYSETQEDDAKFGRIDKGTVNYVIKNKYDGFDFSQYYLCGPEPMIEMVQTTLKEAEVDDDQIKFELFFSKEEGEVEAATDGETKLTVIVDDEEFELSMDQSGVILDAVLAQDIDAPYSCQGGICSSCVAKIKEGTVEMRKNQILTDDELEEGLVLTCQAQPTSAKVVVDYDDI
ncbi:ferredoxin--NADP reductase [Psychroflexus lacisalsi]|jgi:ring-1,2-phenylacetyl-CoA epoxidase subunit PaaE|uniref:Ferredoxin--NADP reductase n=1 Tax=Psychroflexus lacisalsi TaxID=503928 RepID=A0ABP3VIT4_9FLAO|nr:ferredoxin--NADP reductase [Psychroflexus lacisalsi]MBZ9621179.1 ferredoxin--NADP reductase [Psychroflexus lacisalsi]